MPTAKRVLRACRVGKQSMVASRRTGTTESFYASIACLAHYGCMCNSLHSLSPSALPFYKTSFPGLFSSNWNAFAKEGRPLELDSQYMCKTKSCLGKKQAIHDLGGRKVRGQSRAFRRRLSSREDGHWSCVRFKTNV